MEYCILKSEFGTRGGTEVYRYTHLPYDEKSDTMPMVNVRGRGMSKPVEVPINEIESVAISMIDFNRSFFPTLKELNSRVF